MVLTMTSKNALLGNLKFEGQIYSDRQRLYCQFFLTSRILNDKISNNKKIYFDSRSNTILESTKNPTDLSVAT